jgi:NAD(P)-dependent dehydrogenase (short-subunit alcohol dehydrogenase family)
MVADYGVAAGEKTVQTIVANGGVARFCYVDVSDVDCVDGLVGQTVQAFGGIDVLCNCAGILSFGTVVDTTPDVWRRVMGVNLDGTYLCCRAAIPQMIKRGGGAIVNVSSSTGAHDAKGKTAAYVTSKGGVTLLTKAMAIDHAKDHIRVNAIAPGPTDTAMLRDNLPEAARETFAKTFPMKRLGKPEELAQAMLFLASDEASFVTGTILAVDGGQTADVGDS